MTSLNLSRRSRWYPPAAGSPSQREENPNVLEFNLQKTTRQPHSVTFDSIKKTDDKIIDVKKKKKPYPFHPEDVSEYKDMAQVPRGDQHQFQGPSYGDPNFMANGKLSKRK